MAEHSGFFNALQTVDGEYDRTYNANDYSDNLSVVISNGVLQSANNDLQVTADGLVATVNAGRAWINGHYYYNDSAYSFAATIAPTGGSRIDRIMLRLDTTLNGRKIGLVYMQGTVANNPVAPAPTRTDTIYDLVLAEIYIFAGANELIVTDKRDDLDLCGWVYSANKIKDLQAQITTMIGADRFSYTCTGENDNLSLSQIANALYSGSYSESGMTESAKSFLANLGGANYCANLPTNANVEINVVGTCGVGSPVNGTGASNNRYRYFELGLDTESDKKIVFNFAKCDKIPVKVTTASSNIVFFGVDCYVKNATVQAYTTVTGVDIQMVASPLATGNIEFTDCRLSVSCSGNSRIATQGTFVNCYCKAYSSASFATAFYAYQSVSLIRVLGGTVYAYARTAANASCLMASGSGAIVMAVGVNFPTKSYSNYSQMYYAYATSGDIYTTNAVTMLNATGNVTELGKISQSKPFFSGAETP